MESNKFSDLQILEHLRIAFDRPAFKLGWHLEQATVPFEQAISDTILALNTGTRKARDGTIIVQFEGKSKFYIKNAEWRSKLDHIELQLSHIQVILRTGDMNPALIDGEAIDRARAEIIDELNKIFESVGIPTLLPPSDKESGLSP